jgi:Tfp pilus assembly protein PilO
MKSGGLTFIRIIIGVLVAFAVVVVGYQLYKYTFVSIKTESATMGEIEEVVKSILQDQEEGGRANA